MKTKTKYVTVKFDTPQEFCKALFDGRKFRTDKGSIVHESCCAICVKYYGRSNVQLHGLQVESLFAENYDTLEEIIEEAARWEDDLLEYENGILCWVSDDSSEERRLCGNITHYDKNSPFYYSGLDYWTYATPLTKEEALKMVYNGGYTND